MKKKLLGSLSAALAALTVLSMPASAISILVGDGFGKGSKTQWEEDIYEPEEWDNESTNTLYLSVGRDGYVSNRPAAKRDKLYAQQGRKLKVDKAPSTNTWTATIKLNMDDLWYNSSDNRKRVEFRVDLVDGDGNALKDAPRMAVVKTGAAAPVIKFYNPQAQTGWGSGTRYIDGDGVRQDLDIEMGWHTLIINCTRGVITYYLDEKKLGNCTLDTKDVYPDYVAINQTNYNRPDVSNWDNLYVYNGSYLMKQRSTEKQEEYEEKMASKYASRRSAWYSKYWDASQNKLTKEMPDRYWDY